MALRQLPNRVQALFRPGCAIADNPSGTLVARRRPFGRHRARTVSPSTASTVKASSAQGAFHRRVRPSLGSLARPRARIRPPPRRGFAAASWLPALSFAVAARFRVRLRPTPVSVFPDGGYPFHLTAETFRSRPSGRGVERRSSTSAITFHPILEHCRRIVRSPPARYRVSMPFSAGRSVSSCVACLRMSRGSHAGRSLRTSSRSVYRAVSTRSGAGLAFAYASGVASSRGLSLPVSPQLHSYPSRDVHKHLVSQNT